MNKEQMNRIAVYCGSSTGSDEAFMAQATLVGKSLAKNNLELVYGGAKVEVVIYGITMSFVSRIVVELTRLTTKVSHYYLFCNRIGENR